MFESPPTEQPGLFVTVDGPGGVGKSTAVSLAASLLADAGISVSATSEPSSTPLGNLARYGTDTYCGAALALMIAADRMHHLHREVRPAREAGRVVLCDRYVAASYVLQQLDGVPLDFIQGINRFAEMPDLAVVLNADPDTLHRRITTRGAHSRWERDPGARIREYRLYQGAASLLEENGVPVLALDCTATAPEIIASTIAVRITELHTAKYQRETAP